MKYVLIVENGNAKNHRRIRLIDGQAKSLCLKSNPEKDFAAAVFFLPSEVFVSNLWGWSSNFVESESGPRQSVKVLQYIISRTKQHPPFRKNIVYIYS
jgi:hypothetical protein